jgi:hypothetical protein
MPPYLDYEERMRFDGPGPRVHSAESHTIQTSQKYEIKPKLTGKICKEIFRPPNIIKEKNDTNKEIINQSVQK